MDEEYGRDAVDAERRPLKVEYSLQTSGKNTGLTIENMNDMTPTSGGSTSGNIARAEKRSLPGNRYRVKMNASGTPTRADSKTLPRDTKRLLRKASRFALCLRLKNSL